MATLKKPLAERTGLPLESWPVTLQ